MTWQPAPGSGPLARLLALMLALWLWYDTWL